MNLRKLKLKLKKIHFLYNIYLKMDYLNQKRLFEKDPKLLANKKYKKTHKKDIDWNNPTNLIEKIIWMQFNSDTTLWSQLADKYLVRDYVREKGEGELLNILYGRYDSASEIDFSKLPDQFVIKTNHGCGTLLIVKNKKQINISKTIKTLNSWMNLKYGIVNAQLHYLRIKPCIMIEQLLIDKKNETLIDYKFYCVNGTPLLLLVVTNRIIKEHTYNSSIFDMDWNDLTNMYIKEEYEHDVKVEKPGSFDKMKAACYSLAAGIPFVRIDFYDINGKAYFGEMTFTPDVEEHNNLFINSLGSKINIDKLNNSK